MTLLSSKASLQSEEIAPCIIYTHLEESLLKWEIKTGTRSWEASNENILPPYWKTSWISVVTSHYWQRRLMFPTLSNCLKGIQHFLMQLIEIFYLLFSCNQKQDFVNLLNGQCPENHFLRMWRQRSLDIIGWTMINPPVCKLELTLKLEGERGSDLTKNIFH